MTSKRLTNDIRYLMQLAMSAWYRNLVMPHRAQEFALRLQRIRVIAAAVTSVVLEAYYS